MGALEMVIACALGGAIIAAVVVVNVALGLIDAADRRSAL